MKQLLFILLCVSQSLWAQQKTLQFEKTSHNFGTISNKGGPAQHVFTFTNTGTDSVSIQEIKSSCGCTSPDWTAGKIAPGEEGYIVVEFDPSIKPGRFMNSLTISTTKAPEQSYKLYIRGIVDPAKEAPPGKMAETANPPAPAQYIYYFSYNSKRIIQQDDEFKLFIDKVVPMAQLNGSVTISIESSASHVPTELFKRNESLAAYRANEARKLLIQVLIEKGIKPEAIHFVTNKNLVQGPAYNNDFEENKRMYEQYQYVKINAF